jgi:photosystem II stability/assembly factor-like uncharacterized protein
MRSRFRKLNAPRGLGRALARTLCAAGCVAMLQRSAGGPSPTVEAAAAVKNQPARTSAAIDATLFRELKWRAVGPAVTGGRVVDIAVVPGHTDTVYAATASGGVWKTTNHGVTWEPVFERESSVSVGAIALAPSNPAIVWVGTGEANSVRSSSWGDGVYRSDDAGKTWKHLGLEGSRHVGRILVHPTDSRIVYVAAMGSLFGGSPDRGLYKTVDGGASWTKVLAGSDHTGVVDVAMDPRDPAVLFAAKFERERRNWSFIGGGPEGGIYKSIDAGGHWEKLTNGLPGGDVGRIGLAICRAQPDRIYAAVVGPEGGVFRSDDRGASWERRNTSLSTHWYYGQIVCDPNNSDRIYIPQTRVYKSQDGGRTFTTDVPGRSVHGDNHVLWIDPEDSDHLILGNDGGLYFSFDRGQSWRFTSQLPIGQFYAIAVDMSEPFYNVYGGLQDNSSWGGPSGTRSSDGIANADWFPTSGGDGFYSQADPVDSTTVYAESQYGRLLRFDTRTGERRTIAPEPPDGVNYRWNWSAPLQISHHDHKTLYFAADVVFKSVDRGDTWKPISPDLSQHIDYRTLPLMGKVWEKGVDLHASTADYGNISTLSESPRRAGLLAAGTDDGVIEVTHDDGATWTRAGACPGVPERTALSRVIFSRFADNTLYATFDAHRDNDFRPFVCRSSDAGKTWTSITSNLPAFGSTYVIAEQLRNSSLLFVGTEFGVFATFNGGQDWMPLKNNLPTVAVHDIIVHPRENDLVLGTHGRGIWILDDIGALEELTPAVVTAPAHLFNIRPAMEFHRFNRGRGAQAQNEFVAPNPPDGAIVTYSMAGSDAGQASAPRAAPRALIDITDGQGALVRHLTGPAEPGIQRVIWDLRHEAPTGPARADDEGFRAPARGPFVLPGEYRVEIRIGNAAPQTRTVQVKADPLIPLTDPDRKIWHDTLMGLVEMQNIVTEALSTAQQIARDVAASRDSARAPAAAATIQQARSLGEEIGKILTDIRGEGSRGVAEQPQSVSLNDRVRQLYSEIEASTGVPTADQRRLTREAHDQLTAVVGRLNHVITDSLPSLNKALDGAGARWTPGRPLPVPSGGWLPARSGSQQ